MAATLFAAIFFWCSMPQYRKATGLHASITDEIILAIASGAGRFEMPWSSASTPLLRPRSRATGRVYHGINVLTLWTAAKACGFRASHWATASQWHRRKARLLPGERPTRAVIYQEVIKNDALIRTARSFWLYNGDQVDHYEPRRRNAPRSQMLGVAAKVITRFGRHIHFGGNVACYRPCHDDIHMPHRLRFTGETDEEICHAFLSTLLHELVHWTGAQHRLARDLSGRFGSRAYAMEELVAELGSAFLCADLGISQRPRRDHAQYISGWLSVLRSDRRAIFYAASQAERAANYLMHCLRGVPDPTSRDCDCPRRSQTKSFASGVTVTHVTIQAENAHTSCEHRLQRVHESTHR